MQKKVISIIVLLLLVGCSITNNNANHFLIVNNSKTITTELYSTEGTKNKYILTKELNGYYWDYMDVSYESFISVDENKLLNYNIEDHSKEVLVDLNKVLKMEYDGGFLDFYLTDDHKELFFEKVTHDEAHGIFQVSSYRFDTGKEVEWTNDKLYSFFDPFKVKNGIYVLRNKEGTYKEAPKDLYLIECPGCTPIKVNNKEMNAYRLLDIDEAKKLAYIVVEESGGIKELVTVSLDKGDAKKILIGQGIVTVSVKQGILISQDNDGSYSIRNLDTLEELHRIKLDKFKNLVYFYAPD